MAVAMAPLADQEIIPIIGENGVIYLEWRTSMEKR